MRQHNWPHNHGTGVHMPGALILKFTILLIALFALGGCANKQQWELKDISGIMPTLEFSLTDQDGNSVHATDLRGKLVLLYFGYTHCPDVCPTTLTVLSQAVKQLGSQADKVRVLFVTVDPARDTESLLKRYAPSFGPQVMGLRGDGQELARLTKRFRVTYGLGKPDADGNYEVSHSSAVFVFDRKGEARLLGRFADTAVAYAHDLKQLLKEG